MYNTKVPKCGRQDAAVAYTGAAALFAWREIVGDVPVPA